MSTSSQKNVSGFEKAGAFLKRSRPELLVSKQKLRQAEAIQMVRLKRENVNQSLGFASRPFVLCGLPIKQPAKGVLMHERRNGQFLLQVTGHPTYGVPWGQDRLVPIFLATLAMRQQAQTITFRSAAEMLDVFGMQQGGTQYRRLVAAFQRVFGATIFFGTDTQRARAAVMHQARFNFMREARIWYSRDPNQEVLPGGFENEIVLSDEFFREVTTHSIPTDLEAAKALSSSPAALDLFMWLSYRCFTAKGQERIAIFGDFGLAGQLGSADYARPRKFRERLDRWLDLVRVLWPDCPAQITSDGDHIRIQPAVALAARGRKMASALFAPEPISGCRISLAQIDTAVSARLGPTRTLGNAQPACFNRQVAMYLAKHLGRWSTTVIGRFYNGRDHSTVCYSIQRIEALRESDPDVDALISDLRRRLGVKATNACVPSDGQLNSATLTETAIDNLANLIATRVCGYIEKRMAQLETRETDLADRDRGT